MQARDVSRLGEGDIITIYQTDQNPATTDQLIVSFYFSCRRPCKRDLASFVAQEPFARLALNRTTCEWTASTLKTIYHPIVPLLQFLLYSSKNYLRLPSSLVLHPQLQHLPLLSTLPPTPVVLSQPQHPPVLPHLPPKVVVQLQSQHLPPRPVAHL